MLYEMGIHDFPFGFFPFVDERNERKPKQTTKTSRLEYSSARGYQDVGAKCVFGGVARNVSRTSTKFYFE